MTPDEPLLDRTYRLLDAAGLSYRKIAAGSGVDLSWIAKFAQRNIGEPGVSKVQAVHDFLIAQTPAEEDGLARANRRRRKVA